MTDTKANPPDVTTMAGVFLAARAALAAVPEYHGIDPLAALRALPGEYRPDTVAGPDGERWLTYVFADGSSLIHDGWGYRFLAPDDAPEV